MTEAKQIIKAMKNRVKGMLEEAKMRGRPELKQKIEELNHLIEMLERSVSVKD